MSTRRRRPILVALTLTAPVAVALAVLGLAAPTYYVVVDAVVDSAVFVILATVAATASIAVAGWLAVRRGPAAIVVRILTGLLAVAVLVAGVFLGLLKSGFASEVRSSEVIDVSPDGRHDLILVREKDWKGTDWHRVRVRTRAGLLSRVSGTGLADVRCLDGVPDTDRIRAEFTGDRQVTFTQAAGPPVIVAFDESLRPTTFAAFCP
ncbi:hypothetical protein [Actinoplanes sp. NPDC026670]|uniref:hypothetical protein n=1 Tax=Actinoplanes sp. NPDC026670 TaxID=3154700 RepID=UPI003410261D